MPKQNAILTAAVNSSKNEGIETQMYHRSSLSKKNNVDVPSKILLVDDEQEFVQTLSERLQMRDMGTAVAYDGRSALDQVRRDEPEIMIIDLKMPEIDGMELLKQVKQTCPAVQVIVLTGHGCEQDKKKCLALGAFSYMQKPVDINQLCESVKSAYKKIKIGE